MRNNICFDELRSFNNRGTFLGKHPFVKEDTDVVRLRELLMTDPDEFMRRYRLTVRNVDRYSSKLRKAGISPEESENYETLLNKHTNLQMIMAECLKMSIYGNN